MKKPENYLQAAHHYARHQLRERLHDLRAVELEHRTRLLTAEEYANNRKSILQAIAELRTVRGAE